MAFIPPDSVEGYMKVAEAMKADGLLLFISFCGAILSCLLCLVYVSILFIFRLSVHEVEGSFVSAILHDFTPLVFLVALLNFSTNAISYVLLTGPAHFRTINWMIRGVYSFLYIYVIMASIRHMWETYAEHVRGVAYEKSDLQGKVYIVTGSNQGCGYETTMALVNMGATVVMACRSEDKAKQAKDDIIKLTSCSPSKLIFIKLDLSSFNSVREFVKSFLSLKMPLHGLVNNAGLMMSDRSETADGLEMVITANHLSHFLLTNLLVDCLDTTAKKEKSKGRVVNLASALHKNTKEFDFADFEFKKPGAYNMFTNYSQSKLANVLFTDALQARMDKAGKDILVNSVHPGCVMTDVSRHMHWLMRWGEKMAQPMLAQLRKTPAEGAYCSVFAVSSPRVLEKSIKGQYLFHCVPCSKGPGATPQAAEQLWKVSEGYVKEEFRY